MVGGSRAVVALALGGWFMGSAAWAAEKTVVVLGTATPGGGFPVYGAAVADIINETDPTLAVQTRNTKGSTENVPLLEAGQLDLALVQGEVVHEALTGVGRSPANLMILAAMYSTPGMFVVRADGPHRAIADLRGKPVAFGAPGSGLVIRPRRRVPGARRPPRVGRLVELHHGASHPRRRRRVSPGSRAPPRRAGPGQAPASGARDDGDEYDRCRSARGPRPPRCPALPARDRNRTLTRARLPTAQDAMPTTRRRVTHAWRGPNMMTNIPATANAEPAMSHVSGRTPSASRSHNRAVAT